MMKLYKISLWQLLSAIYDSVSTNAPLQILEVGIPFHFPGKCFLAYQTLLRNLTEMSPPSPTLLPTFTALFLSLLTFASATNGTIVVRGSSTTLLSENGTFQMGFFNASGESKWYLGIWYSSIPSRTYVWVANRENPTRKLETSTFEVDRSGRLAVKESENLTVWQSSNVEFSTGVKLLDNGNLVLLTPEGMVSWQSFDHPTDTWLPGMNLTSDQFLTSWQSSSNPSPGLYSLRLKTSDYGEFELVYNATKVYWITGNWTGEAFANVPEMTVPYIYNFSFVDPFTPKATFGFTSRSLDNGSGPPLTGFKIDCMGRLQQYVWWQRAESWNRFWERPESVCRVYGFCGSFGLCDSMRSRPCECLPVPGFKPVDDGAWESGDYSGGCRRENESSCDGNDEFDRLGAVRFDGAVTRSFSGDRKACERACLNDCACVGLYYDGRSNLCKNVYGSLLNLQNMTDGIGGAEEQVLYVRVAGGGERTKEKIKRLNLVGLIVGIVGSVLVLGCVGVVGFVFIIKRGKKRKGMDEDGDFPAMNLKVFSYKELHSATRGFSEKLGHGGFGTVFQGVLPDSSTLVAVKRLERPGGGEREFRAEVRTIGNIQHLNLVRLRGFCSENSHRLLVYDYMPNGPLSAYLRREGPNLSWDVRFRVALGTARGIAYLHEECRDCIIHCDIKPENILLDSEYTAKLSDFGLAKLIGRDFSRVLATLKGTWGYVAPEWISGIEITTKADVYSYGMTLLELIGGRRNVEAPPSAGSEGRAGGVVGKWFFPPWASQQIIEGNLGAVVDSRLGDAYDIEEAKRSALVAVWCIQDNEAVRPSMGMVVKMLEGMVEVTIPPVPKLLQALVSGDSFSGAKAASGNGLSVVGGFYGENMAVVSGGASESSLGDASSATNENVGAQLPKFDEVD
ncbi:G-type lectin S-receptor-like serine/threonine-protein kinase SD2-2 isoform X2 [Carya illinoinensis]|nr:G-type lectin S-receptor-like serine/threonine-protein kinase SD2-2 isoform X2 [Carya illinoinensis]KAG6663549.1 hypothetical protein CIPAW_02G032700 [Carya illinoinensis]